MRNSYSSSERDSTGDTTTTINPDNHLSKTMVKTNLSSLQKARKKPEHQHLEASSILEPCQKVNVRCCGVNIVMN